MLAIVIPSVLAIFARAYWFRAPNNCPVRDRPCYSGGREVSVWLIPHSRSFSRAAQNNILARAFGVLIVCLIRFGSLRVMIRLNSNLMPMDRLIEMQR